MHLNFFIHAGIINYSVWLFVRELFSSSKGLIYQGWKLGSRILLHVAELMCNGFLSPVLLWATVRINVFNIRQVNSGSLSRDAN